MGVWGWVLIVIAGVTIYGCLSEHIADYKGLQKEIENLKFNIEQKNNILSKKDEQIQEQTQEIYNFNRKINRLECELEEYKCELEEYKIDFNVKREEYNKYVYTLRDNVLQSLPEAIKRVPTLWADIKLSVLEKELAELEMWGCRIKATTYMALKQDIAKAKEYIELYKQYRYKYENLLLTRHPSHEIEHEQAVIIDLKQEKSFLCYKKSEIQREINKLEKKIKELKTEREREQYALAEIKKKYKEEDERIIRTVEEFAEKKISQVASQGEANNLLEKMAEDWAEFKTAAWDYAIVHLLNKKRPISIEKATEYRKELSAFKKDILQKYKETDYKYNYLLSLFPELQEYIDGEAVQETMNEAPEELEDRREYYIPKEEWVTLSESQRSQIALNRYNERRRLTNSQVGRDYEEYIAFLFRDRLKGAVIDMYGEQKGLADLGRDLIVKHSGKVYIVQCKRWSQEKVIREKHIMQLYGSTIEYCWDMREKDIHPIDVIGKSVIPVFVTTTGLSSTATRFAERLGVIVRQVPMSEYPQIKCNIGKDGEKIYHLPFDQQYNSTIIEHQRGEFYAWNVEEAEEAGYRRAQRHFYN